LFVVERQFAPIIPDSIQYLSYSKLLAIGLNHKAQTTNNKQYLTNYEQQTRNLEPETRNYILKRVIFGK